MNQQQKKQKKKRTPQYQGGLAVCRMAAGLSPASSPAVVTAVRIP
jgi:hypothetical protein